MCIEFHERGYPYGYVNSFIWIFTAHNIQDETTYVDFNEKTLNTQLPGLENEPDFFELVKTDQIHSHSRTCWKYNKMNVVFRTNVFLLDIAKPLEAAKDIDAKNEILMW